MSGQDQLRYDFFDDMLMYGWIADRQFNILEVNPSLREWMRNHGSGDLIDRDGHLNIPLKAFFSCLLEDPERDNEIGTLLEKHLGELADRIEKNTDRLALEFEDEPREGNYALKRQVLWVDHGTALLAGVRVVKAGGILMHNTDELRPVDLISVCQVRKEVTRWKVKGFQGQLQEGGLRGRVEQESIKPVLLTARLREFGFAGSSQKTLEMFQSIERVARTKESVLIQGETGTGKELVATAIHKLSNRTARPLIKVNCAVLPESLIESELFGIRKRVATAVDQRPGKFLQANGGTLFLDEIANLSLTAQANMLRVLQDGCFCPVGGLSDIRVDVRVIAATNKDLAAEVQSGSLGEDLYHRIAVLRIDVPPLRERKEEIPSLGAHFLSTFNDMYDRSVSLSQDALDLCIQYDWPGNVRQLRNAIVRGATEAINDEIRPEDLRLEGSAAAEIPTSGDIKERQARDELNAIVKALQATDGKKTEAGRLLGYNDRFALRRRVKTIAKNYPDLLETFPYLEHHFFRG